MRTHVLGELSRLPGQERRLVNNLGQISLELHDFDEIGCLGIGHLSLTSDYVGRVVLQPSMSIFDTSELD